MIIYAIIINDELLKWFMIAVMYNFLVLKDVSLHEEIFCVINEPTFSYLSTKNLNTKNQVQALPPFL